MLAYIKYMNINYPPKVRLKLESQGLNLISLNLVPPMSNDLKEKFPNDPLPGQFEVYHDFYSNFLVNFWQPTMSLLIVMGVLVISSIVSSYQKKDSRSRLLFSKVKQAIKWNITPNPCY